MSSTCWEILGLNETGDSRRIRAAWFDLLRRNRPQDDDDRIVQLRIALREALHIAREWQGLPGAKNEPARADQTSPEPVEDSVPLLPFVLPVQAEDSVAAQAVTGGMTTLYADFALRQQAALWQQLLTHECLTSEAVRLQVTDWLVNNLQQMPFLSSEVKSLLWRCFDWDEADMEEAGRWDETLLHAFFARLHEGDDYGVSVSDLTFSQPMSGAEIDAWLRARQQALSIAFEEDSAPFIAAIDALLQQHPVSDPDLLCWLATHFRYMGNADASREYSQQLIALAPGRVDGYLRQAQINMQTRYYYRACDDFCRVLDIDSRSIHALKGLAQCLLALGYYPDAREIYRLIADEIPFDAEARIQILHIDTLLQKERLAALKAHDYRMVDCELLAESYNHTGAYDQCIDFVLALRERAESNRSLLWRLFKSSIIGNLYRALFLRHGDFAPRYVSAPLYIALGEAYEYRGKREEAKKAYQWALNAAHHVGGNTFPALYPLLNTMSDLKEWEPSVPLLEEALTAWPNHAHLWHLLAEAYRYTDRLDEALDAADRSIALDASRWIYFSTRSLILMRLEQYERALSDLDEVVRCKHSYDWGWHRRGICLSKLGRYDAAIHSFEEAIDWKIDYAPTALEMVKAACEAGNYQKARRGAELYAEYKGDPQPMEPWLVRIDQLAQQDNNEATTA